MENNKGLISVVIPAYNAQSYIEECVNSILCQSYKNFEIIIVNDGSKDGTLDVLNTLSQKDERIQVYSKENGGVSSARNEALKHAKGEFVTYVDADDSVTQGAFQSMINEMADDVDMLVCSHNEVRITAKPKHETPDNFSSVDDINKRFIDFDKTIWWPWAKLLRRSVIDENNLVYDTGITFGEDHIFNLEFAKHIKGRVVVSETIAYNYHFLRGGLCSHYYPNMNEMQKYVFIKIADYFGGIQKMPREYYSYYVGCYFQGLVEYYIAWKSINNASEKIKETYEDVFSDVIDDEILNEYFTEKQAELLKNKEYTEFVKDYIKLNPKATIWRKIRRSVRRVLEAIEKKVKNK